MPINESMALTYAKLSSFEQKRAAQRASRQVISSGCVHISAETWGLCLYKHSDILVIRSHSGRFDVCCPQWMFSDVRGLRGIE